MLQTDVGQAELADASVLLGSGPGSLHVEHEVPLHVVPHSHPSRPLQFLVPAEHLTHLADEHW